MNDCQANKDKVRESERIKMLKDAGYQIGPVHENYVRLVEFVEYVKSQPCSLIDGECCVSCYAKGLLEKIGEL